MAEPRSRDSEHPRRRTLVHTAGTYRLDPICTIGPSQPLSVFSDFAVNLRRERLYLPLESVPSFRFSAMFSVRNAGCPLKVQRFPPRVTKLSLPAPPPEPATRHTTNAATRSDSDQDHPTPPTPATPDTPRNPQVNRTREWTPCNWGNAAGTARRPRTQFDPRGTPRCEYRNRPHRRAFRFRDHLPSSLPETSPNNHRLASALKSPGNPPELGADVCPLCSGSRRLAARR
jgi:hypothetical protein